MELAFVQSGLLGQYLDSEVVSAEEVATLLKRRGLLDGMPVFLDDETMMPLPALSEWGRYLSTGLLDETTLRDYGRMAARLDGCLDSLGSDVLSATESDLVAYRNRRRLWQKKPVVARTWGKEASILDDLYHFLVARGSVPTQPVRLAARGRNALAPGVRSNMDIRHLTFEQYRYFRDVGLGGQLPDEQVNRGWAPLRNRAGADLALGTGARWREWATVLSTAPSSARSRTFTSATPPAKRSDSEAEPTASKTPSTRSPPPSRPATATPAPPTPFCTPSASTSASARSTTAPPTTPTPSAPSAWTTP
ncbi:hypothetical protein ACFVTP_22930 [Streptomyces celluloflavus]|uniref:hypothetical protein n=1 Tax=Streptomyces celluloflavus TaxID=58344 RepID=UPI0036DA87D9